ncbi:MAG TPA: transcriptional regulator Spx [Firmicutes bacterium]|jgi:regulatory protein spx|nr:transcriptional regulator Spx [Bacillota bacterium]HAV20263.1 transcriptional regulator Spx [Bacillota bacterium]
MILIYTSPSCSSCRKVKKWFEEQQIPFEERNIFSATLNEKELKEMLSKSENGTEDIISTRSKIIKEEDIDLDSMSISDLIEFIRENPSILKRPIIVDDRRIQVGYNEEEIRTFIPLARRYANLMCTPENCEKYDCCDHILAQDLTSKSSN